MAAEQPNVDPSVDARLIREPLFATVKRGYEPRQVLDYLSEVADQVEALQAQIRELESELSTARNQQPSEAVAPMAEEDPYDGLAAHLAEVMRAFDQDVDRLQEEKKAEAERLLAEARVRSEGILADARARADGILADARRVVSGLASRRDALLDDLRTIREHVLGATSDLDEVIKEAASGEQVVVVENAMDGEPAAS
jgi:cell division septum initiation protein DivIVA